MVEDWLIKVAETGLEWSPNGAKRSKIFGKWLTVADHGLKWPPNSQNGLKMIWPGGSPEHGQKRNDPVLEISHIFSTLGAYFAYSAHFLCILLGFGFLSISPNVAAPRTC